MLSRIRLCAAIAIFGCLAAVRAQEPADRSVVFYAMDPTALIGFTPKPAVVRGMLNALVSAITGRQNAADSWKVLFNESDVVGIKVAASPGELGGTRVAVVEAIASELALAGVRPENILVWDRNREDLIKAGFRADSRMYRLRWIDAETGYDPEAVLTAPVLGRLIWGDSRFGKREGTRLEDILASGEQLSSNSYMARILSRDVTKVINVPSAVDSFMTGINGAIANMTLWNVDNWRRFVKEPDHGNPYLAEMYGDPRIGGKVVLTIMDALTLQIAGGPLPNPSFARPFFTLYASRDPVAIDATVLRLLEEYRVANKLPELTERAGHVESAAIIGLGNFAEDQIDQIRVGIQTDRR